MRVVRTRTRTRTQTTMGSYGASDDDDDFEEEPPVVDTRTARGANRRQTTKRPARAQYSNKARVAKRGVVKAAARARGKQLHAG